jgi:hypothetical protein
LIKEKSRKCSLVRRLLARRLPHISALTPENFKVARERAGELFELFKELDEITGMLDKI